MKSERTTRRSKPPTPQRGDLVWLDSTAIIEAHRVGIWKPLSESFRLVTVAKCLEEIETGNLVGGNKVTIDTTALTKSAQVLRVTDEDRVVATVESRMQLSALDEGERDLLSGAFRHSPQEPWFLSSQDKACLRVGTILGMVDRFVSLEMLAAAAHVKPRVPFREQFTEKWMSTMRTRCRLGTL